MGLLLKLAMMTGMPEKAARLAVYIGLFLLVFLSYAGTFWYGSHVKDAEWQARFDAYNAKIAVQNAKANEALAKERAENAAVLLELYNRYKDVLAHGREVKIITQEVTKYVTRKADAGCTIPAGFVWMYDFSVSNATAPGTPGSPPGDVDAPSGVALSEVAAIAAENNAECVARGEVIELWQEWYVRAKARWEQMRKEWPK